MIPIYGFVICLIFLSTGVSVCALADMNVNKYKEGYKPSEDSDNNPQYSLEYRIKKFFKKFEDFFTGVSVFSIIIGVIFILLLILHTMFGYTHQIGAFEKLKEQQNIVGLYESKAKSLTMQFAKYLLPYQDYEKSIYDKISPDNIDIYMAKYPELRTSDTIIALVDNIHGLQTEVYDAKITIERIKRKMRYRKVDPWAVTYFIPTEQ
jgi:hypothetical protein